MYSPGYVSSRNRLIAFLLCVFLGYLGVHRFYAGKIGTGLIYLFTGGFFGIGWLIDACFLLAGAFRDADGLPITEWGG